jgi:hypothetical protein
MWREHIEKLEPDHEFFPSLTWAELTSSEDRLGLRFPDELRSLLQESNGVHGQYGLGLIWPIERIIADNLRFRTHPDFGDLYMPFDCLLFFADAGNGDQFAFPIQNGRTRRNDVFVWNHEDDSRTWVAPSLSKYLEWWLDGTIKL